MSVACIIVIVMNNTLVLNAILRDFIPQTIGGGGVDSSKKKLLTSNKKSLHFHMLLKWGGGLHDYLIFYVIFKKK